MLRIRRLIRCLLIAVAILSAALFDRPPRATASRAENGSASKPVEGLTVLLSGIEGGQWSMALAQKAFRDAGVSGDVRVMEWGIPLGGLNNLMSFERNQKTAARLAEELATYRRMRPRAPINIVGYSGGGGMAVMITEALPKNVHVQNLVLVQGAVSRDHDLSNALAHVDGRIVNFHCASDAVTLGAGTEIFGNIDRGKGPAAGKDGFEIEKAVPDAALRKKVEQIPWSQEMIRSGHFGGHVEILGYQWNKDWVAPKLIGGGAGEPSK